MTFDVRPAGPPAPPGHRWLGHLPRWTQDPLALLEQGASLGPRFSLQLWRKAIVGYTPDWNRLVLGNLDQFRSRGSLSQLSPYLSAGVVATDNPGHRARRAELNPAFHRRTVTAAHQTSFTALAAAARPAGEFDAATWASRLVNRFLSVAFFGDAFPRDVLHSFLAPLDRPMPGPLLRRPFRIRKMERALAAAFQDPVPGTLAECFAGIEGGVQEARVAIAAAYDTTAHTLAFALWELAAHAEFNEPAATAGVVDEALRLYPSGWIGSRVCVNDVEFDGQTIPAGRLVLYSPYLTHRDPALWSEPQSFRPERFSDPLPAWGYIPFSAGERTCLGAALATLMLRAGVSAFHGSTLIRVSGSSTPRGGLTLVPAGPLRLHCGVTR